MARLMVQKSKRRVPLSLRPEVLEEEAYGIRTKQCHTMCQTSNLISGGVEERSVLDEESRFLR
jgi:hypothetical protein